MLDQKKTSIRFMLSSAQCYPEYQRTTFSLLGDCNARLGPEDALFTYNSETNRNGEKRVDFMEEFNLVALNARFMKPLCKRHGHSSIQISKELC